MMTTAHTGRRTSMTRIAHADRLTVRTVETDRVLLDVAGGEVDGMGWEQTDLARPGRAGQ
jgi:hypothetical protein